LITKKYSNKPKIRRRAPVNREFARAGRFRYGVPLVAVLLLGVGTLNACYLPIGGHDLLGDESGRAGSGISEDPYIITDAETLVKALMGDDPDLESSYTLAGDLDLTDLDDWTPIGLDHETGFTGTFDGAGHSVFTGDTSATTNDPMGLFGKIGEGGTVKNVGVEDADFHDAGKAEPKGALAAENHGTIERAFATGTLHGGSTVGGLVGLNTGTIRQSYAQVDIKKANVTGGLVGTNEGTIGECYAAGEIDTQAADTYGAFIGFNDSEAAVSASYFDADLNDLDAVGNDSDPEGITALSDGNAKSLENYEEFTNVWADPDGDCNDGYPYLSENAPSDCES